MKSNPAELARQATEASDCESAGTFENSRSMKFGEFLQVMIAQMLKKKSTLGITATKAISDGEERKKAVVLRRLTMNLEPLIEFFRTTLSQPDRFIYAHYKRENVVSQRADFYLHAQK